AGFDARAQPLLRAEDRQLLRVLLAAGRTLDARSLPFESAQRAGEHAHRAVRAGGAAARRHPRGTAADLARPFGTAERNAALAQEARVRHQRGARQIVELGESAPVRAQAL